MDIGEIGGVGVALSRRLIKDGWSVSRLATIDPARLERYPGVSPEKAQRIVAGARKLVNRQGEREARPAQQATSDYIPPATSPLRESERVRRIREGMRQ
jgi:ERCC4-type nuclease